MLKIYFHDKQTISLNLFEASKAGNLSEVQILLTIPDVDPNITDKFNCTALSYASRKNNLKIVQLLLSHGADPNTRDIDKLTPLFVASEFNFPEIVELLLLGGADPNILNKDDDSPLSIAIHQHNFKIVEIREEYFSSLKNLSVGSIRKHRIDITKVPSTLLF